MLSSSALGGRPRGSGGAKPPPGIAIGVDIEPASQPCGLPGCGGSRRQYGGKCLHCAQHFCTRDALYSHVLRCRHPAASSAAVKTRAAGAHAFSERPECGDCQQKSKATGSKDVWGCDLCAAHFVRFGPAKVVAHHATASCEKNSLRDEPELQSIAARAEAATAASAPVHVEHGQPAAAGSIPPAGSHNLASRRGCNRCTDKQLQAAAGANVWGCDYCGEHYVGYKPSRVHAHFKTCKKRGTASAESGTANDDGRGENTVSDEAHSQNGFCASQSYVNHDHRDSLVPENPESPRAERRPRPCSDSAVPHGAAKLQPPPPILCESCARCECQATAVQQSRSHD